MKESWSRRISCVHRAWASLSVCASWSGRARNRSVDVRNNSATGAIPDAAPVKPSALSFNPAAAFSTAFDCASVTSPSASTLSSSCAKAAGNVWTASRNALPSWSRTAFANFSWGGCSALQVWIALRNSSRYAPKRWSDKGNSASEIAALFTTPLRPCPQRGSDGGYEPSERSAGRLLVDAGSSEPNRERSHCAADAHDQCCGCPDSQLVDTAFVDAVGLIHVAHPVGAVTRDSRGR